MSNKNKILFENGQIITMNQAYPFAENILLEDSLITGVDVDPASLDGRVEKYDLQGKTIIPGLNDSHLHLIVTGMNLDMVDLKQVTSLKELQQKTREYISRENLAEGEWVMGWGWNEENFDNGEIINRRALDEISQENPMVLTRNCGHMSVLNSRAIDKCGITSETEVRGGMIELDQQNVPTGVVAEKARRLIYENIPEYSLEEFKKIIAAQAERFRAAGLTMVQSDDFAIYPGSKEKVLQAYFELVENNELPVKVNLQLRLQTVEEIIDIFSKYPGRRYTDYFTLGPLKIFADGSLGAKTAALREPYAGSNDNYGIMFDSPEELEEKVDVACRHDVQVACHAIGDRAIKVILNIYAKMKDRYGRINRPRIIHAQVTDLDLIKQMRDLGAVVDAQPPFVCSEWDYATEVLGKDRAYNIYAWKTMLDQGIVVAGGSDSPVESYNPFAGIKCAVTRQDSSLNPAGGWLPNEKLTRYEALKMYTVNSAYSCFQEKQTGRLASGYRADFLVLEQNPYKVPADDLDSMKVRASVINGNIREY